MCRLTSGNRHRDFDTCRTRARRGEHETEPGAVGHPGRDGQMDVVRVVGLARPATAAARIRPRLAAAAALGRKEAGVGLGIYQALFFLGGGTGPAVIGAFLAARREAAAEALNPLYTLDATSFSDAFLVIGAALLLAFVASLKLRRDSGQPETGGPATVPVEEVKS